MHACKASAGRSRSLLLADPQRLLLDSSCPKMTTTLTSKTTNAVPCVYRGKSQRLQTRHNALQQEHSTRAGCIPKRDFVCRTCTVMFWSVTGHMYLLLCCVSSSLTLDTRSPDAAIAIRLGGGRGAEDAGLLQAHRIIAQDL